LNELVVIIKDQQALDSLKPLENYILSEANVKKLTLKSETTGFVKTRAEPDHKRLGIRLRKDKPKVDRAIQNLTEAQIQQFEKEGKITLEGHELTLEDIRIIHEYGGEDKVTQHTIFISYTLHTRLYYRTKNNDIFMSLSPLLSSPLLSSPLPTHLILSHLISSHLISVYFSSS
jgi:isoleucyl-tRNA synthetase